MTNQELARSTDQTAIMARIAGLSRIISEADRLRMKSAVITERYWRDVLLGRLGTVLQNVTYITE